MREWRERERERERERGPLTLQQLDKEGDCGHQTVLLMSLPIWLSWHPVSSGAGQP